ncbi:MAG: hypothetical protein AAGE13_03365 [Pseudomonadota bacterium]
MRSFYSTPLFLALLALAVWVGIAVLLLAPGHLAISGIEGDVLHALDGAARIAEGARQHVDFATPLGLIAFGLPAELLAAGFGPGRALILSNIIVAALILPALIWLRITRLSPLLAALLALWALFETTVLVHDDVTATVTMALYYNRWCWAVFILMAVVLLIPVRDGQRAALGDGLILGLGAAFLVLVKLTFMVALILPLLVWILSGKRWRVLAGALASGTLALAAATLWSGDLLVWPAYLADLLQVATSDTRPQPGMTLPEVMAAPQFIMGSFALVASIMVLRMAGLKAQGLMLLTLMPGMIYVTYQNWANAPVWLVVLTLLLLDARPRLPETRRAAGMPARTALGALTIVAVTQVAPYVANVVASPFRHLAVDTEEYSDQMPVPGWDDLLFLAQRNAIAIGQVPMAPPPPDLSLQAKWDLTAVSFQGREFAACAFTSGLSTQMQGRAESLSALPDLAQANVMTVDLLNVTWMFAGGRPLPGGSPWYYGGTKGFETADWFVVPTCPQSTLVRALILEELGRAEWQLVERFADDIVVVYERVR